jgi:hypothetical protein
MILQRVEIYVIALDCVVWNKEDVHDFVRGVHLSERTQGLPSRRGHASLKYSGERELRKHHGLALIVQTVLKAVEVAA